MQIEEQFPDQKITGQDHKAAQCSNGKCARADRGHMVHITLPIVFAIGADKSSTN